MLLNKKKKTQSNNQSNRNPQLMPNTERKNSKAGPHLLQNKK
jgi:hypothetical protein